MPGFSNGDTAPHYVYSPASREWWTWAEYEDGYVGTMKGHSVGHTNCGAFQVEILAYSDKALAASAGGIWVGDFTEDHYRDLADFYAWAMARYGDMDELYPEPAGGWKYGTSSPYRMTEQEWCEFSGLTAHGAVPGNTHWDTGVLDLTLIYDLAYANDNARCPWAGSPCDAHYYPPSEVYPIRGNDVGENQGSCNVTTQMQPGVAWAFDTRRYKLGNGYRYDYDTLLTEGRSNEFVYRDNGSPEVPT